MNIEKPNHPENLDNIRCTSYIFFAIRKIHFFKCQSKPLEFLRIMAAAGASKTEAFNPLVYKAL